MLKNSNLYWQLFSTFFKIGLFTFGGGWAMIRVIEEDIVRSHKWLSHDDFLDLLAVAQSMPGILAVNIAVAVGDKLKGLKGALAAAMGTILPSFAIILAIAIFLTPETIKNNDILTRIFKGIRPAVVALILVPVVTTARASKISGVKLLIPITVAILIYSKIPYISNPIVYIVLGATVGYIRHTRAAIINQKGGTK